MKWLRSFIDWQEQPDEFHEAACLFVKQLDEHGEDRTTGGYLDFKNRFPPGPTGASPI